MDIQLIDKETKKSQIHLLPCRIDHEGEANVSKYFIVQKENEDTFESSFRGRALKGLTMNLPKDYQGFMYQETTSHQQSAYHDNYNEEEEEVSRCWKQVGGFDQVTVWGHDQLPTAWDTPLLKLKDLLALNSLLMSSINK